MVVLSKEQIAVIILLRRRAKRKVYRDYWVHPLNLLRPKLGEHLKLELMYSKYPEKFFEYTRLTPYQFDDIMGLIEEDLLKVDTNYRLSIPPRQRFLIALRYLCTGDSFQTIATSFSTGKSTVRKIIKEVNTSLWNRLAPTYMKIPDRQGWDKIVKDFNDIWNFPNCLGAVDGKHVMMQAPPNSGSLFFNYKGYFSLVLLATCDAHYRFTTVDIGGYGRQSDGGIFNNSGLGNAIFKGKLDVPGELTLPGTDIRQLCTFIGDDAFALSQFMMKPYPEKGLTPEKRVFNYRLSRARRVIENVFGIMAGRFRIYKRSITADPENVVLLVKATTVLHNYLRTCEITERFKIGNYCPPNYLDTGDEDNGEWRAVGPSGALEDLSTCHWNNYTKQAGQMRDDLSKYFQNVGRVEWQDARACLSSLECAHNA